MTLPGINLPKKPIYTKISERLDFYKLFRVLENSYQTCFILESLADESYDSRYSVIGFDPEAIFWAEENSINLSLRNIKSANIFSNLKKTGQTDETTWKIKHKNPYNALREIFPKDIIAKNYAGGLVGYLSYEAVNFIETGLNLEPHSKFDLFRFGLYTDGLVYDKFTGEVFYFHYLESRLDVITKVIKNLSSFPEPDKPKVDFLGNNLSEAEHKEKVLQVIEEIKAGNTFQCEAGFKSVYQIKGNSLPIYTELRKVNPSPYMFYLKFGNQKLIGASPELLFRLRDGQMETFPLAGTAARGATKEEDLSLVKNLLNDEKELAEHKMLVDMHRNDLGRVAKFGTVKVRKLMDIVKYRYVQHISSEVIGIIKEEEDMFSGLASLFPGGVLTGAPKVESIKIILRNEKEPRGPYGGAVGHFGLNGDCTFCIPIRSLYISGEYAFSQTCSGIVYDSKPEEEYQEILNKLAGMKNTLSVFN